MGIDDSSLKEHLQSLLRQWRQDGVPSRWELQNALEEAIDWKGRSQITACWPSPPLLATATLDDGWGHGLQIIELCAHAAGLQVISLGLLQTPSVIIKKCQALLPDLLGMTILQFDSEDGLKGIADRLPSRTRLIAGGPVFQIDPEFAARTRVHHACRNIADFLEFILAW